jgi:hypothetical protein
MKNDVIKTDSPLEKPEEMHLKELNPDSVFIKIDRFVLGRFAPNPEVMRNYCPYAWLTVAALILLIPVAIVKFLWLIVQGGVVIMEYLLIEPLERAFLNDFKVNQDKQVKVICEEGEDLPWYVKREHYKELYEKWIAEEMAARNMTRGQIIDKLMEIFKQRRELENQRKASQQMSWKMPKVNFIDRWVQSVDKSFDNFVAKTKDVIMAQKMLIKATQRFLGLLLTLVIAAALFFVLNFMCRGIIWLYDIWDWAAIGRGTVLILILAVIIGLILLLLWGLGKLLTWLKKVVPANNLVFRGFKVLILTPLYFIFVVFLWKIICVAFLWEIVTKIVLWGFVLFLIRGVLGVGPLFKEYFGQEYKVLCPGIKWVAKVPKPSKN